MAFAAGGYNAWLKEFLVRDKGMSEAEATDAARARAVRRPQPGSCSAAGSPTGCGAARPAGRLWTIVMGMALTIPCAVAAILVPAGLGALRHRASRRCSSSPGTTRRWRRRSTTSRRRARAVAAQGLVIFTMHMIGTAPASWVVGEVSKDSTLRTRDVGPDRCARGRGGGDGDGDASFAADQRTRVARGMGDGTSHGAASVAGASVATRDAFAITSPHARARDLLVCVVAVRRARAARARRRRSTRYGRALKNHDFGSAYDLMSSSFRGKVSREDYVRMMRDNPREVDETAERLRGKHGSLEVSAEFEYGLGRPDAARPGGWALADLVQSARLLRPVDRRRPRCARSSARTGSSAGT